MAGGGRRFITVVLLLISSARCLEAGKAQLVSFSPVCVYTEHIDTTTGKQHTGGWQG